MLCDIPGLDDSKPWANFHIKQVRAVNTHLCLAKAVLLMRN